MSTPSEQKKPEQWLKEFHDAFGIPSFINQDSYGRTRMLELRMRLIREEFLEVMDELLDAKNGKANLRNIAKELADLCVVTIGTAQLMEIPFTQVFEEVMRSNISKVNADGTINVRADGKILKPLTYKAPDLTFLPA